MEKIKNIPSLRFSEFNGDFEQIKFGKLYSFQTTNSLSRDKLNYEEGKVYNIHYGDIHTKFQPHFYLRNESVPYINVDVDLSKIKAELYCKTGDIIIADASEDYADIGKSIELIDIDNVKLLAGLHTLLARPISDKIFVGFTSYLLKSWTLRKQIMTISQGSKVLSLSTVRVSNLELNIPTFPEQQKIASFLSAVDEKIQQLSRKKELLEQYKKGLMQQLFSGKLRFKPARPAGGDENGKDYADWERGRFSKYIKLYRGSSPRPIIKYVTTSEDGVNWIKIGDTKQSKNYRISSVFEKITKKGSLKSRFVERGEIILANSMSFGKSYLLQIEGCIYDGWFVLREYEKAYDKEFLLQVLNSEFLQRQYFRLSTGGVVQNISSEIVYSTLLFRPVIEEQQKIANFLSSIDTKIESTSQQITQTQSFKKGLLQQLFV